MNVTKTQFSKFLNETYKSKTPAELLEISKGVHRKFKDWLRDQLPVANQTGSSERIRMVPNGNNKISHNPPKIFLGKEVFIKIPRPLIGSKVQVTRKNGCTRKWVELQLKKMK